MIGFVRNLFRPAAPIIADARSSDAPAMAHLHKRSFHRGWGADEFERLLMEKNVVAHGAKSKSKLIGFILSRRAADEAEILSVAVDPAWRRRKIGRALLNHHMGRLVAFGTRTIFLEVDPDNRAARQLYDRAAFREAGQRPGYYAKPGQTAAPALILRRDLG